MTQRKWLVVRWDGLEFFPCEKDGCFYTEDQKYQIPMDTNGNPTFNDENEPDIIFVEE